MGNVKKAKLISIIVICLAISLLLTLVIQFTTIHNLEKKNSDLNSTLTNLEEEIAQDSKQRSFYQDRENYLDEYARDVENMSKSGDIVYVTSKN